MIRPITEDDFPAIEKLHHAMGFDYKLPNLCEPLFVVKLAQVDTNDKLIAASVLKLQSECYLWIDPTASLRVRLRAIMELSKAVYAEAFRVGLDCMVAYLPPGLPPAFRRVLNRIGWSQARTGWDAWSSEVK